MARYAYIIPDEAKLKEYVINFLRRKNMTLYQLGKASGITSRNLDQWLSTNNRSMLYANVQRLTETMLEIERGTYER